MTALGFYAEHELAPPEENSGAIPTQDEATELRQIASALPLAAAASTVMPAGVLNKRKPDYFKLVSLCRLEHDVPWVKA